MNQLVDLPLGKPLPGWCIDGLMFASFTLHLIFVLLTIGTAILGVYFFVETWWGGKPDEGRWHKQVLRTFLPHKSLAVVLGIAALLVIQVGYGVPFLTAVNLHAWYWILIVPFLVIAFLSFDALGHKIHVQPYLHLFFGIVALVLLFAVPGVFVAVLVTAENPACWIDMIKIGGGLHDSLVWHWLARYAHVIGAALVFGAAFHYGFTAADDQEKRSKLLNWLVAGVLFQIAGGVMLYGSIPSGSDALINTILLCGILATVFLVWSVFSSLQNNVVIRGRKIAVSLMAILLPMLLVRQGIQNRTFVPLSSELHAGSERYNALLTDYKEAALLKYSEHLEKPANTGQVLYMKGCAFCHGQNGDGSGQDSRDLEIAPEQLREVRSSKLYLRGVLLNGVPGTSMPTFTFYDRDQLGHLLDYLNVEFNVFSRPVPIPVSISPDDRSQARETWKQTCAACHGQDGRGSSLSVAYRPAPPDLMLYGLAPQRAFRVITHGYPRTMMVPFNQLPEQARWALVELVAGMLRRGDSEEGAGVR